MIPSKQILDDFKAIALPQFELIARLRREEHTLAATRDALLPKLVTGEIRVPDNGDPSDVIERVSEAVVAAAS